MSQGSLYDELLGKPEDSTIIYGQHRSSKLAVALKVIFKDIEADICVADLPEVAIPEKLSNDCNIVRHIEHFQVGPYIYLVQACMSLGDLKSFV